jgi:hypothetical protein
MGALLGDETVYAEVGDFVFKLSLKAAGGDDLEDLARLVTRVPEGVPLRLCEQYGLRHPMRRALAESDGRLHLPLLIALLTPPAHDVAHGEDTDQVASFDHDEVAEAA